MKLLCFVDLHGDIKSLRKIIKKAKKADILVCAGDLSMFGNSLDIMLYELNKIGKPVLVVTGNHESDRMIKEMAVVFKNIKFIDKKTAIIGEYIFIGYGGGGFAMVDQRFRKYAKVFKKKMVGKKSVLILHGPPYGFTVDLIHGEHSGNKDYTAFIKDAQPDLVVCGHLHETANRKDKYKKTVIINPGWEGVILEL